MFHCLVGGATEGRTMAYPSFAGGDITAGFSFRTGGTSKSPFGSLNLGMHVGDDASSVKRNRALVGADGFGPVDEWVFAKQVHGNTVVAVGQAERGAGGLDGVAPVPECDALVTNAPQTTLAILVADCVPVLFYDEVHHAIGAAHSGWRGTTAHIVLQVMLQMRALYGTRVEDLRIAIGPSIRQCCYEVDDLVMDPVKREFGDAYVMPRFNKPGKYWLSLQACIKLDLLEMGVQANRIEDTGLCTACNTNLLFSHRAEHGNTGRLAGLIRMKDLVRSR